MIVETFGIGPLLLSDLELNPTSINLIDGINFNGILIH